MHETRRRLMAAKIQLTGQLAVSNHETRKSLNEHVKQLKACNQDLVKTITSMSSEINTLTNKLNEQEKLLNELK